MAVILECLNVLGFNLVLSLNKPTAFNITILTTHFTSTLHTRKNVYVHDDIFDANFEGKTFEHCWCL